MYKIISFLVILNIVTICKNVESSKARMEALGQDEQTSSHYILDTRDVYSNPGSLNILKKLYCYGMGYCS